jgi:hypothetical protein
VLSLLLLESAPPPAWHHGWEDTPMGDSVDHFPDYGRAAQR